MSQDRSAPAFQEYAAQMIAQLPFRTMTLQHRGLLYTMRLECWVNMRLPQNPDALAKVLGFDVGEVAGSLAAVMPFFEVVDGFIISPELEQYRTYLAERKIKQSQGGKRGSAITNTKRHRPAKAVDDVDSSTPSSTTRLPCRGGVESSVQHNPIQPNTNQLAEKAKSVDAFVVEYEAAETVERGKL
jgi:hypothetical protein